MSQDQPHVFLPEMQNVVFGTGRVLTGALNAAGRFGILVHDIPNEIDGGTVLWFPTKAQRDKVLAAIREEA